MDATQILDSLRADIGGCDTLAFADLSTGMILCASMAVKRPQEEVDALCDAAGIVLNGALADAAAPSLGGSAPDAAIAASASDLRVYLRAGSATSEVLIILCGPDADTTSVVSLGRTALSQIADLA